MMLEPSKASDDVLGTFAARQKTSVNSLQLAKVLLPILLTPLPMVTEVRLLQSEKALLKMLVTLLGMVTEVRLLQPEYLQLIVYQIVVI